MFPQTTMLGRLAVLGVAVLVLVAFSIWCRRTRSRSFFLGVLAGTGLFLSFDFIWIHTIFGLHHLTSGPEDVVLEPLFVLTGLACLGYALTRERGAKA